MLELQVVRIKCVGVFFLISTVCSGCTSALYKLLVTFGEFGCSRCALVYVGLKTDNTYSVCWCGFMI